MTSEKIEEFKKLYQEYKSSDRYLDRQKQKEIAVPFKEIIRETLKNQPLRNEHLTGLIQMFGWRCKPENFNKYLVLCVPNKKKRLEIIDMISKIGERGFTNIGKTAITKLHPTKLAKIKDFLVRAFDAHTVEEAIKLCEEFDQLQIPQVKQGIYSPWLFYINPALFPMVNNSHHNFKKWFGFPDSYPECIKLYHDFNNAAGEPDLAAIDFMAHLFTKDGKLNYRRYLDLQGKKIFKISHGIFSKKFKTSGLWEFFEEKKWVCMHEETGKNQGKDFSAKLQIGDYVYLCYGGDELSFIGKIISKAKPLPVNLLTEINEEHEPWIYREVQVLFEPKNQWINTEMKKLRYAFMPSGNTTFSQIPDDEIEYANTEIFIPYYNVEIYDSSKEESESKNEAADTITNDMKNNKGMKNLILYGPPGTGKTYGAIDIALQIMGEDTNTEREDRKKRFAELQNLKRISFTTFHQNMAYEDFIEGIKPLKPEDDDEFLKYDIEDGLFMQSCVEATYNYMVSNMSNDKEVESYLDFNDLFDTLYDRVSNSGTESLNTRSGGTVTATVTSQGNFAIRHSGREKPYTVSRDRLSVIYDLYPDPDKIDNIQNAFRKAIGGCNSTAYWSVLNAIAIISKEQKGKGEKGKISSEADLNYKEKKTIVSKYWKRREYQKIKNDKSDPFVFIIDEINRGNIAQIFGELITLIEEDKRMGNIETIYVDLPYSKSSFAVPPNLYIVGTMNTADRSIEALDTALRRRFSFIPKMPEEKILGKTSEGIDLSIMLTTINNRLKVLKDTDHTIGHAWLWNVTNIKELQNAFQNKILPLLQEYFFNDYEKLGLVLGDAFFKPHVQISSNIFAVFTGGNGLAGQYDQSWQYQLKSAEELTISDFQSLVKASNNVNPDEE